jgi:hypothetical protein
MPEATRTRGFGDRAARASARRATSVERRAESEEEAGAAGRTSRDDAAPDDSSADASGAGVPGEWQDVPLPKRTSAEKPRTDGRAGPNPLLAFIPHILATTRTTGRDRVLVKREQFRAPAESFIERGGAP